VMLVLYALQTCFYVTEQTPVLPPPEASELSQPES